MERLRQIEEQTLKAQKGKSFFLALDSKLLLCHQLIVFLTTVKSYLSYLE